MAILSQFEWYRECILHPSQSFIETGVFYFSIYFSKEVVKNMLTLDKVFNASVVLRDIIRETALIKTSGIAPDCELYLKPENLQNTGFKIIYR